ncbi:MAG: ankyrin repeat domain-containing protein, partial [Vicinamibacterales bacterium]
MHLKNHRRLGVFTLFVGLCLTTSEALSQTESSRVADAVKSQDWAVVQALLDDGADINTPQGDGATALHWAAYWDDLKTAQRLVAAGATVHTANDLGVSPLWLACNNGS